MLDYLDNLYKWGGKSKGMALRQEFQNILSVEEVTLTIRYPNHPVADVLERLESVLYSNLITKPFRWKSFMARDVFDEKRADMVYGLVAGRVPLLKFIVGKFTDSRAPTLVIQLSPHLTELYCADTCAYRILKYVLETSLSDWHIYGVITNVRLSYNLPIRRHDLLVWRDYIHGDLKKDPEQLGNCRVIERTAQYEFWYHIHLQETWTSIEWNITPQTPLAPFVGVRGIANQLSDMDIFDINSICDTLIENPDLQGIRNSIGEPKLFAREVKANLTYDQRNKLLKLFRIASPGWTLTDGLWDRLLRAALNKSLSASFFAN